MNRWLVSLLCCLSGPWCCTPSHAAAPPYFEDFEGYAEGPASVANLSTLPTGDKWEIVGSSYSGKALRNRVALLSGGSAGALRSSAALEFPDLASSAFHMSTTFRVDVAAGAAGNFVSVGMAARATGNALADVEGYHLSYILDGTLDRPTGRLFLRETHFSVPASTNLNWWSASALPVTLGDVYQMELAGTPTGETLALRALLTNLTSGGSLMLSTIDEANILTGPHFGYLNRTEVVINGRAFLTVDMDQLSVQIPEPSGAALGLTYFCALMIAGKSEKREVNQPRSRCRRCRLRLSAPFPAAGA